MNLMCYKKKIVVCSLITNSRTIISNLKPNCRCIFSLFLLCIVLTIIYTVVWVVDAYLYIYATF